MLLIHTQPTTLIAIKPVRQKLGLLWDPNPWSIITFQNLYNTSLITGRLPTTFHNLYCHIVCMLKITACTTTTQQFLKRLCWSEFTISHCIKHSHTKSGNAQPKSKWSDIWQNQPKALQSKLQGCTLTKQPVLFLICKDVTKMGEGVKPPYEIK